MKNLPELLTKTIGMARIGRAYTDAVLTRAVDGDEHGIAIGADLKVSVTGTSNRGNVSLAIFLESKSSSDPIELDLRNTRALFGFLYGVLSAEFDEELEDGAPKPLPDQSKAFGLLREAQALMGGEPNQHTQEWFTRANELLARTP